jgi:hypothetical protein
VLAGADEEFSAQFRGEIVELQADGAGGDVHFIRGQGDAGSIHDGEEKLELAKIHAAPCGSFSFTKYNIQLSAFDTTVKQA